MKLKLVDYLKKISFIKDLSSLRKTNIDFIIDFLKPKDISIYKYNDYIKKFIIDREIDKYNRLENKILNAEEIDFIFDKIEDEIIIFDKIVYIIIKDTFEIIELIKIELKSNVNNKDFFLLQEIINYYKNRLFELREFHRLEQDAQKAKSIRELTNELFSEIEINSIILKSFSILNDKYFVKNLFVTILSPRTAEIYKVSSNEDLKLYIKSLNQFLLLRGIRLNRKKIKDVFVEDLSYFNMLDYQFIHFDIIFNDELVGVVSINIASHKLSTNSMATLKTIINLLIASVIRFNMYNSIRENYLKTIKALAIAVDAKDSYTHTHSENVMKYAEMIANKINLDNESIEVIRNGALLHDVGKIGIPGFILNKPGNLSKSEFENIMQQHVIIGANIIKDVPFLSDISKIVYYHHECYDGSGYPEGLKKNEIPLGARIVAVADVFDALTTNRPYRKALSFEEAIDIIKQKRGTHLDPKIVDIFLEIISKKINLSKQKG